MFSNSYHPIEKFLYRPTLRNRLILGSPNSRHLQPPVPVSIPAVNLFPSVFVPRGYPSPVSDRHEYLGNAARYENHGDGVFTAPPAARSSLPVQPAPAAGKNETDVTRIKSNAGELRVTSSNLNGCTYFNYYLDDKDKKAVECPCPYHRRQGRARKIERKFPNYSHLGYMAYRSAAPRSTTPCQHQVPMYQNQEFRPIYKQERPNECCVIDTGFKLEDNTARCSMSRTPAETFNVHTGINQGPVSVPEDAKVFDSPAKHESDELHTPVVENVKVAEPTIKLGADYIRNARMHVDPERFPDIVMKHGIWCKRTCCLAEEKKETLVNSGKHSGLAGNYSDRFRTENNSSQFWTRNASASTSEESGVIRKRFNIRSSRSKERGRNVSPVSTIRKSILLTTAEKSPSKSSLKSELTTATRRKPRIDVEGVQRKYLKFMEGDNAKYEDRFQSTNALRSSVRSKNSSKPEMPGKLSASKPLKASNVTTRSEKPERHSPTMKNDAKKEEKVTAKCPDDQNYSTCTPSTVANDSGNIASRLTQQFESRLISSRHSIAQDLMNIAASCSNLPASTSPTNIQAGSSRFGVSAMQAGGPHGDELNDKIKLLKSIRLISEILEKKAILGDIGFPGLIEFSNSTLQTVMTELVQLISSKTNTLKKRGEKQAACQESDLPTQKTSVCKSSMDENAGTASDVIPASQPKTESGSKPACTSPPKDSAIRISPDAAHNPARVESGCKEGVENDAKWEQTKFVDKSPNINKELFREEEEGDEKAHAGHVRCLSNEKGNGDTNSLDAIDIPEVENVRISKDNDEMGAYDFSCFPFLDEVDEKDLVNIDVDFPDGTSDPNVLESIIKANNITLGSKELSTAYDDNSTGEEKLTDSSDQKISVAQRISKMTTSKFEWMQEASGAEESPSVRPKLRSEPSLVTENCHSSSDHGRKHVSPEIRKDAVEGLFACDSSPRQSRRSTTTANENTSFSLFSDVSSGNNTVRETSADSVEGLDEEILKKFHDMYLYMPLKRNELWPGLSSYGKYEAKDPASKDQLCQDLTEDVKNSNSNSTSFQI